MPDAQARPRLSRTAASEPQPISAQPIGLGAVSRTTPARCTWPPRWARSVGVYWCFNLVNAAPLTRARHRPFVSWRMHCPACGAHCTEAGCDHPDSFVAEIPVEGVMEAARQLLAAGAA